MTTITDGRASVLDHGYVQLIESWGSDERIVEAARMSTGKGFKGWGVEETCAGCDGTGTGTKMLGHGPGSLCPKCRGRKVFVNTPGDEKLLKYLYDNKHMTPFEMAGATFEIQAPIFVFREWHRHRTQGYNEMSARYEPLPDVNYVPTLDRVMAGGGHLTKQAGAAAGAAELTRAGAQHALDHIRGLYLAAESTYQQMLSDGVPKELARLVIPVGRYSRMRATANLRNWMQFLTLRDDPHAQWEIQQFAKMVSAMLTRAFPRTMTIFTEARR